MSRLIVFDADSIIFTVAWRFRTKKISSLVKLNTNKFISDVLRNSNADDYIGFYGAVSGKGMKPNFRYSVDPKYKGNRPPTPDFVIKWRPTIHSEFKDNWGFMPVEGMEADDAVAITVEKYKDVYDEIIVATFDKDLKQIPNIIFYNMKTHKKEAITKDDAAKNFYNQMLMGDTGDNIPGLRGVGKAGAKKILKDCVTEFSLFRTTVCKYKEIEDTIRNKELTAITKQVIADLEDVEIDTSESIYKGLSGLKLERKIRINSKSEIQGKIDGVMPGGWKDYFNQQYKLLRMITEEHEDLTIPDVQENPVKQDDEKAVDAAAKDILDDDINEFLTV